MPLKAVFITGCGANGIGTALAQEFHMRGHHVFATGRSTVEIDPILNTLGIQTFTLDVTSEDSVAAAVRTVDVATNGRLDILINIAGILQVMPFADTPASLARQVMEVNVVGVWAVTHAFLPLLVHSRGLIANMGSINQVFCPPFLAAYNASKAAVEAMSRTIRRELAPFGVRVVTLKTGSVRTGLFGNAAATELPEQSLYSPLRKWIESRGFQRSAKFIEVQDYAKGVVSELLKDDVSPVIWKGGLVYIAWFLSWFGWETIMDQSLIKGNYLDKLSYKSRRNA